MSRKPRRTASDHQWSDNAKVVLRERYFKKDSQGRSLESVDDLLWRVASAIAAPEAKATQTRRRDCFFSMMARAEFLPNSPTLMNAGLPDGQLSACFVLPVLDSLDSIFDTLKSAALIHQSGGGTGFSFSRLRPRGEAVSSSQGVAGGPISFLGVFDQATEAIKQGGVRRGANMGVLRVDHPDILEFIALKKAKRQVTNFNLSVGVTAEFWSALLAGDEFRLRCPRTGKAKRTVLAPEVFSAIIDAAWSCGDPGLIFLDRTNLFNPTPFKGSFEATNPCGEQPLLAFESCNLGSINLSKFGSSVATSGVDWVRLEQCVHECVRFLDNVIEVNAYPLAESERITRSNRKIGLGVMGFADLLLELEIPYGSGDSIELGERLMAFIDRHAKRASARLARERGAFAGFRDSLWSGLGYPPLRNATVSTVAPTGTISLLAGASSGIEPIFAAHIQRNVLGGKVLREVHPAVKRAMERRGVSDPQDLGDAWKPARELPVAAHLAVQAAFQRHADSAVSKTVNLPESASREEVATAYLSAERQGCKGITIYRDQSLGAQVLEDASDTQGCDLCVD